MLMQCLQNRQCWHRFIQEKISQNSEAFHLRSARPPNSFNWRSAARPKEPWSRGRTVAMSAQQEKPILQSVSLLSPGPQCCVPTFAVAKVSPSWPQFCLTVLPMSLQYHQNLTVPANHLKRIAEAFQREVCLSQTLWVLSER